jgi:hypothetical protein
MQMLSQAPVGRNDTSRLPFSPRVAGTFEAHRSLLKREADELASEGVPPSTIADLRVGYIFPAGRTFEFDQHVDYGGGKRAYLFLVTDSRGDPIDIIGWQPARNWIGTWRGIAWALNQQAVFAPRVSDHGALRVHQSPLEWLRDECRGIVLVQPHLAAGFLCDAGPLIAENSGHRQALKAALTRPSPRILVAADAGTR